MTTQQTHRFCSACREWLPLTKFVRRSAKCHQCRHRQEARIRELEAENADLRFRREAGQRCMSDLEMQKITLNHRAEAAEAKLAAIEGLLRKSFVSVFMDGRNEHGTHFLPMGPTGVSLTDEEFESAFDSHEEATETLFQSAEALGYRVGHVVVVRMCHDKGERYWYHEGVSKRLTKLLHGSPSEQDAMLRGEDT